MQCVSRFVRWSYIQSKCRLFKCNSSNPARNIPGPWPAPILLPPLGIHYSTGPVIKLLSIKFSQTPLSSLVGTRHGAPYTPRVSRGFPFTVAHAIGDWGVFPTVSVCVVRSRGNLHTRGCGCVSSASGRRTWHTNGTSEDNQW